MSIVSNARILLIAPFAVALSITSFSAAADVQLPRILSDGAILQRDQPVVFWGTADPGEAVALSVDGEQVASGQADADGQWRISSSNTFGAGGPHTVTLAGDNRIELADVYFGDVWLASGQSNMELPMARVAEKYAAEIAKSANTRIRQFKVPKVVDYQAPQTDVPEGSWVAAAPDTLPDFSAVGYFFAKAIEQAEDVPVGIVTAAYGGSTAQSWMSPEALKAFPHYLAQAEQNAKPGYVDAQKAADRKASDQWYSYINKHDQGLADNWLAADADSQWQAIKLPGFWSERGLGEINGVVWLKKTVMVPESAAGQAATLRLGRIVDADTAYVNGQQVGNITYQYPPRIYPVPTGVLKAGANEITVRLITNNNDGGFVPDKPYALELASKSIDLAGEWRYRIGVNHTSTPPTTFWDFLQPVGMYNAMLSPLFNVPFKGVIWYQGESNVGAAAEYAQLLPALVRDWRAHFKQPRLPFIVAQLPGFGALTDDANQPSDWAVMRDSQAHVLSEPNTALTVNLGLGEWNDIHPLNKKGVADRLALAARKLVYAEAKLAADSPAAYRMSIEEDKILISVAHASRGLVSKGKPSGFAIAGGDGEFVWAKAELQGDHILVWSDKVKAPTRVRYGWADFPDKANVKNRSGLPLMPFSLSLPVEEKAAD
ncbi:sialate O-acetylesterase [Gilvimarinus japonicus]|uniref:Sialate O-acetylesterase n=1 Tax=Gilvimarinus japonicus TaxID=1796469 RepID=A0ABV7HN52_9GAMM